MSDPASVAAVRLLIADTDPTNQILTDTQVGQFVDLEGGVVKLAAAQALDSIASSEALVSKVIRTQDLATDGAKTAAALRDHAARLREQAAGEGEGWFEVVDVVGPTYGMPGFGWF